VAKASSNREIDPKRASKVQQGLSGSACSDTLANQADSAAFSRKVNFKTRATGCSVPNRFTVYLVDDEPGVLKALSRLLRARGYDVRSYSSPQLFLEEHDVAAPGCAVLDISMPGLDGLELQRALTSSVGSHRPIVFITGKGDVPTSVRAMKAGALDFLTKPVNDKDLLEAISRAEVRDATSRALYSELESIQAKVATLTPREREVWVQVVAGRLNKQIAGDLGIVEKTAKVHRRQVMEKLGVRNVADLVRMAEKLSLRK
jgi:FixJ family two-component response regulator